MLLFLGVHDVDEGFVEKNNLVDVLGSEAVPTITTSNLSAATTVRRATRKIVTPKSSLMIIKKAKRSKGDEGEKEDGGLVELMKLKMMHRMHSD